MAELMALVGRIESAGFDGVGILDSQLLCRDTFVTLGQVATHTSRLAFFPAVTNPFTRHASVRTGTAPTTEEARRMGPIAVHRGSCAGVATGWSRPGSACPSSTSRTRSGRTYQTASGTYCRDYQATVRAR
jgi:hypothetical protein